jgi:hypothetical protein
MMSASGRIEHAMLKKRNLMDFFLVSKPKDAERPITEWVMTVGKTLS